MQKTELPIAFAYENHVNILPTISITMPQGNYTRHWQYCGKGTSASGSEDWKSEYLGNKISNW